MLLQQIIIIVIHGNQLTSHKGFLHCPSLLFGRLVDLFEDMKTDIKHLQKSQCKSHSTNVCLLRLFVLVCN